MSQPMDRQRLQRLTLTGALAVVTLLVALLLTWNEARQAWQPDVSGSRPARMVRRGGTGGPDRDRQPGGALCPRTGRGGMGHAQPRRLPRPARTPGRARRLAGRTGLCRRPHRGSGQACPAGPGRFRRRGRGDAGDGARRCRRCAGRHPARPARRKRALCALSGAQPHLCGAGRRDRRRHAADRHCGQLAGSRLPRTGGQCHRPGPHPARARSGLPAGAALAERAQFRPARTRPAGR